MPVMFRWDKGLDFEAVRRDLERRLSRAKRGDQYSNLAVMLIQLVNGSRVSEAVEAWNRFLETGERELSVRVRKRRGVERKMLIPEQVKRRGVPRNTNQVKVAARRLGFNTHALRYAFIGWLGKQGVAPQLIGKITMHGDLDYILYYTQRTVAEEVLRRVVRGK